MAKLAFTKASKRQAHALIAIDGPSGSGKTWNALELARSLVGPEGKIATIDTEHGSASKYSDLFQFDSLELESFSPRMYCEAIDAAEAGGFDVLVIDSLSHAWSGKDGILEQADKRGGRFDTWKDLTPQQNAMLERIMAAAKKMHVIVTMRTKTEYVVEKNDKGKSEPRKVGTAPVQRDGVEYEFDVVIRLDDLNTMRFSKSRCPALTGQTFRHETPRLAAIIKAWITDGAPMEAASAAPKAGEPAAPPVPSAPSSGEPAAPSTDGVHAAPPATTKEIRDLNIVLRRLNFEAIKEGLRTFADGDAKGADAAKQMLDYRQQFEEGEDGDRFWWCSAKVRRTIVSTKDLTGEEARRLTKEATDRATEQAKVAA